MTNTAIVWPTVAKRLNAMRKVGRAQMSRPAVISLSLVESIDGYGDAFADAASDGVIDATELARLVRMWRPIPRKSARLHESVQGAIRALTG